MGLNQNQMLCGPLIVWDIAKKGYNNVDWVFQMVVVFLLGMRRSVEDQLCFLVCMKLVGIKFGPRFQWLPTSWRWSLGHQDCQKTALGLFLMGNSTQSEGVFAHFTWQFLSTASYFGVPVVLLIMSFWENPKYFPYLKQSGTYVLKECKVDWT